MKCKTLLAAAAILVSMTDAGAADFRVKGVAADSLGVGEAFATIRIFNITDTVKPAVTAVTDENGRFNQRLPKAGEYLFRLSSVGRDEQRRNFTVDAAKPVANLDTVYMVNANTLSEVTVTAMKPLISREIDRIGYDVQGDSESKTSMLDEMLKKVPMVTVEPDGTIKIKGSSDFKIYKNGRRNNSFSNNAKDIFKAIPASMIKRVEVITDPGAREDAEGVGMILNIVTVENTLIKGVMGSASLSYSTNSNVPSPGLWLSSQIDKVTFSVYGGMGISPMRSSKQRHSTERTFDDTGNTSRESTIQRSSYQYYNTGMELSYEMDTLNLFTAEFSAFVYSNKTRGEFTYGMFDAADAPIYSYASSQFTDPSRRHWLDGALNYQRSTRRKGEKITLSYMVSGSGSKTISGNTYHDMVNMPVQYTGINTNSNATFLEHTFQVDWTRPLWKGHTLDVGGKYIYRDNHSKAHQNYVDYREVNTNFSHVTQVGAAFVDYRYNVGKLGFRAGVRYEFSRLAAKFHDGTQPDYHSTLNDWVPNAAVSYNINDNNSMRLSYSTNINRPGINYLNPMVNSTPQQVSQGNPDLGSVRNQSLNLNYSFFSSKVSLDFNAGYYFSENAIIDINTAEDDIIYSTYDNAGKNHSFRANLYMQWSATKKTSVMLNSGINYVHYTNPNRHLKTYGWNSPNVYFRVTQKLPWQLSATGSVNYWGRSLGLYSIFAPEGTSRLHHSLSLQRSFLKENRLTVRVGVYNPFGPKRTRHYSHMVNVPYTSSSESVYLNSNIVGGISVSYRFGSLKAQVKKVKGISNDDVVGGASRGQ